MVICIFGESCVGKSTLAEKVGAALGAKIYTGKDYLRLAKSEPAAREAFTSLLQSAMDGEPILYVVTERDYLSMLPRGAVRVLVTASLETIQERFAARMHGHLPPPVRQMLERNHGCFDQEPRDLHVGEGDDLTAACERILELAGAGR